MTQLPAPEVEIICRKESFNSSKSTACSSNADSDELVAAEGILEQHYEVREQILGRGACAAVRAAACRRTGRKVAVKTYDKRNLTDKRARLVRREADILRGLSHSNLVAFESIYESSTNIHMVMELIEGGELYDHVRELGCLSEREAAGIMSQALRVVSYLHSQGIVHRDIKLDNLMFERRRSGIRRSTGLHGRSIKLIDLGFATTLKSGAKLHTQCGTLQYVAPEVLQGCGYDQQADLFSLGAVAYNMLTGKDLYLGSLRVVKQKNQAGRVDFCSNFRKLSCEAQGFVRGLLRAKPYYRLSAQQALDHRWLQQMQVVAGEKRLLPSSAQKMLLVLAPLKLNIDRTSSSLVAASMLAAGLALLAQSRPQRFHRWLRAAVRSRGPSGLLAALAAWGLKLTPLARVFSCAIFMALSRLCTGRLVAAHLSAKRTAVEFSKPAHTEQRAYADEAWLGG